MGAIALGLITACGLYAAYLGVIRYVRSRTNNHWRECKWACFYASLVIFVCSVLFLYTPLVSESLRAPIREALSISPVFPIWLIVPLIPAVYLLLKPFVCIFAAFWETNASPFRA